ncbi:MAG: radical SAM protein [Candidatus Hydrogenedentales bacterium]
MRSVLLRAEHDVCVYDFRAESLEHALMRLSAGVSSQSDIIGFTCFFDSYLFIERAIQVLRAKCPRAIMLVGGPTPSALPEVFLKEAKADVVALGEGESAIVALAGAPHCIDLYDCIPGIAWQPIDGGSVRSTAQQVVECLDDLPACDWSYADLSKSLSPMFSAGRGCPGRCTFCNKRFGPKRFRSPEVLRRDLSYVRDVLSGNVFFFNDSDFVHDNRFLTEYCSILKEGAWEWSCFASPYGLTPELLVHLFNCGCTNIRIGVEAHDEEMIRRHRPGFSLPEMNRALEILEASPIPHITCYYALGLPGQTPKSLETILREVKNRKRIVPRAFQLLPLPGSAVFQMATQEARVEDVPAFLRSLESVRLDEISTAVPNLSACTPLSLAEAYRELACHATERNNAGGTAFFP